MAKLEQPIGEKIGPTGAMAIELILNGLMSVQAYLQIDDFRMAAYVGQALGDQFGCADCKFEQRTKDLTEEEKEAYKQTLLLNFHDGYNLHRAMHERGERCEKPEPKIV